MNVQLMAQAMQMEGFTYNPSMQTDDDGAKDGKEARVKTVKGRQIA